MERNIIVRKYNTASSRHGFQEKIKKETLTKRNDLRSRTRATITSRIGQQVSI